MGALAQLSQPTVAVEPGRSATITITVRNDGTVVDRYSFEALGDAAPWVSFNPPSLPLFPEATGAVEITLSPPRDPTTAAGPVPLGIRVFSSEDPAGSVVEEATVYVAAFSDITVELVPSTVSGRFGARARLAVDNRSNCGYQAQLSGTDPRSTLGFSFRPSLIDVAPGAAAFVKLGVRPARRMWKGAPRTYPFRVVLTTEPVNLPAGPAHAFAVPAARGAAGRAGAALSASTGPTAPHKEEVFADGSMLQEPVLPRWLAAAVGVVAALVILWFALLRPVVRSTAQDEVNGQVASVLGGTGANGNKTETTNGNGTPVPVTTAKGSSSSAAAKGPSVVSSAEIDGGKQATGNGTFLVLNVPSHQFFEITDLLVENAAGNNGILTLADNGKTLMQWAMVDFRDLDYHWITPTVFSPGTAVQLMVTGCGKSCSPGIYYAGHLVSVPG